MLSYDNHSRENKAEKSNQELEYLGKRVRWNLNQMVKEQRFLDQTTLEFIVSHGKKNISLRMFKNSWLPMYLELYLQGYLSQLYFMVARK